MLQAVLVDDEELSLEQLSYVLAGQAGVSIIGSYVDPIMAIEYIRNAKPDIVFVDVSMPCINGFQLVKEIVSESYHPYVVFVTAHSQYAINAFEVEAVDYVPKPIFKDRIEKALLKIRKRLNATPTQNIVKPANEITSKAKVDDLNCFPVEDNGAITLLDFNEVYYCTVDSKTTTVHTAKKCIQ